MFFDANLPVFREVPDVFVSPFPSADAYSNARFQAILASVRDETTVGAALLTRLGGRAWNQATQMLWKTKAVLVGDVTQVLFDRVAWLGKNDVVRGLVAEVPFLLSTDPRQQLSALARVGADVALAACSSVPIAGWIVSLVLGIARVIASIWSSKVTEDRTRRLPWSTYQQTTDEDMTRTLLEIFVPDVDWSAVFLPPTDALPWVLAEGLSEGQPVGSIFAPLQGNKDAVAYSGGFGLLPGTFRAAGIIQSMRAPQPADDLLRYYDTGQLIRVGDLLTNTGDFYPFLCQLGGQLWQQARRFGSPDAFKIDVSSLRSAWSDWFGALYSSALEKGLGDLLLPYLAREVHGEMVIGVDAGGVLRPQTKDGDLVPLVTPSIWERGLATPATRTPCFFQEGSKSRSQVTYPPTWNRDGRGEIAAPPPQRANTGRQCVPWPPGELLLSRYHRVDRSVVEPALRDLAQVQEASLARSLVCAYVRPDAVGDLPRYGAFRNADLRARCMALRKTLLQHPARYGVDLATADAVDPEYAAALRESGVSALGGPQALAAAARRPVGPDPNGPGPPAPGHPQGGVPFAPHPPRRGRSDRGGTLLLGGAAALAALGLTLAWRRA